MKIYKLFFVLMLVSLTFFGQEKLVEFTPQVKFSSTYYDIDIVQEDSINLALLFRGSKKMNAILFDKDYKVEKNLMFNEKYIRSGGLIMGRLYDDNKYTLYQKKGNNLYYNTLSFDDETIAGGMAIDLKLTPGFKICSSIELENKLYIFTAKSNYGILNIYEFSGENNYKQYKFSIIPEVSNLLIHNSMRSPGTFNECYPDYKNQTMFTLYHMSNIRKCNIYSKGRKFLISMDNLNDNYFTLLDLDSEKAYEKKYIYGNKKKSTISVFDENIIQLITSKDSLELNISDIKGNILKKYLLGISDSVSFKNTLFYKRYKGPDNTQVFYESFDEVLKNIHSKIPVLIVEKFDTIVKLAIGTRDCYVKSGEAILNALAGSSQNRYFQFGSYFECLFDSDKFNHIDGDVPEWNFDVFSLSFRVSEIEKELGTGSKYLFSDNDYDFFGKYINKTKKYEIIKVKK